MKKTFRFIGVASLLLSAANVQVTLALGDVSPINGAKHAGMADVGGAIPMDATSGSINPALMGHVGNIVTLNLLAEFSRKTADYAFASAPGVGRGDIRSYGPQKDKRTFLPGALFGFNYVFNPKWSFGVSLTGRHAITKYENNIAAPPSLNLPSIGPAFAAAGAGNRYLTAMAEFLNNSLVYKPNDCQSYGFDLVLGHKHVQTDLRIYDGGGPLSRGSGKAEERFGAGFKVGALWKLFPKLDLGVTIATPVYFQRFKKYSDLLRYTPNDPWNGLIGLAWEVAPCTKIGFDIEGHALQSQSLFGKNPSEGGLGLRNIVDYKLGLEHRFTPEVVGRLGYNFGQTLIRPLSVHTNAWEDMAGICEHMVGVGCTYSYSKKIDLDLAVNYFFEKTLIDDGTEKISLPLYPQGITKGMRVKASGAVVFFGFNYKY